MKAPQRLHSLGQSIWLDNITRDHLDAGTIRDYINRLSVTGLTSNPTIFEQAIKKSAAYDENIRSGLKEGKSAEEVFFDLALEDLARAADLFRPTYEKTDTVDGWVSLEVSPLLAYDTASTIKAARDLYSRAGRPNLFIKIPGTREGLAAIEETLFAGVPVNVTLLFSREHYLDAAEAWMKAVERRLAAGLDPNVGSVASLFVSRWDSAVAEKVPEEMKNRLGIAMAERTYRASLEVMQSPRWKRIAESGAKPQRLLFASTGTKDPAASDILYINSLPAPDTVNTMPESTLLALSRYDEIGPTLDAAGGNCEEVLSGFVNTGIDLEALAARLQEEGAKSFVRSWNELLAVISAKGKSL